jgi:hypothetical protein
MVPLSSTTHTNLASVKNSHHTIFGIVETQYPEKKGIFFGLSYQAYIAPLNLSEIAV